MGFRHYNVFWSDHHTHKKGDTDGVDHEQAQVAERDSQFDGIDRLLSAKQQNQVQGSEQYQ